MEVPVLNRITEFGGELDSLPNPNFLSRIFISFSPSQHFWKWGALIFALLATFTGLINRVKILIVFFRRRNPTRPIYEQITRSLHGGESGRLISENFRFPATSSSESEDENKGDWDDWSDFRVKGSGEFDGHRGFGLRRRHGGGVGGDSFSWSGFGLERSVVRQWGDVNLKCEFEEMNGSVISLYDENEEAEICSIFSDGAPPQAVALSPEKMVVTAGEGGGLGNVAVKLWDTRCWSRSPVVAEEWHSPAGKIGDVHPDFEKVYIRDNGAAGIMIGDVRKVGPAPEKSPVDGFDGW